MAMLRKRNIMSSTNKQCDFCNSKNLASVYKPINTARGMMVFCCDKCGLLQSLSNQKEYIKNPPPSMSADANRASIFYTKDIENTNYTSILTKCVTIDDTKKVMDIGSNRGAFYKFLSLEYPDIEFHGVEPNKEIVKSYQNEKHVTVFNDRFENVKIEPSYYDLIYCVHTLEHANSARQMMFGIWDALKNGGFAFIAVPNIGKIAPDTITEYFIDTHNYHFNHSILSEYFVQLDFEILYSNDPDDEDIILLLKKTSNIARKDYFTPKDNQLFHTNMSEIQQYHTNINNNRNNLITLVKNLEKVSRESDVIIWGAGRILDAIVRFGRLDTSRVSCLVDKYLFKYMQTVHGIKIKSPESIKDYNPTTTAIFIASVAYSKEIEMEALKYGFNNIIKFEDAIV
jgi:2-polyprenyl-3-methyl-5-hydroxy-6-metoxy-1,4-benzoquinol methylase